MSPPTESPDQYPPIEAEVDLSHLDATPSPKEGRGKRVERTRARLAFALLGLLSGIFGVLLGLLASGGLTPVQFQNVTGVAIAPVIGLVGAATGYYYGKGDR